jgi:hypothetical protein
MTRSIGRAAAAAGRATSDATRTAPAAAPPAPTATARTLEPLVGADCREGPREAPRP